MPVCYIHDFMKSISILLLLLLSALSVNANRTEVSTAAEINDGAWAAGDTIIMKNGTWTDQIIKFSANGTAEQPIVLMAETPGEVILSGRSRLSFSGEYIEVSGLFFKDGDAGGSVIEFRTKSSELARNCRVTNTVIENYNPANNLSDSKWVSIYGEYNRVDHCSFVNKTNQGTLLVVWMTNGIVPNHAIDHNFFGYRIPNLDGEGKELNGQEIIRIGTSDYSLQNGGCEISNNYFEHCNGEIEIISNKSCENVYTNNLFYECVGMLTLRHGNRCTVEGNYFFGNGISDAGGVRIIGEDHKVYNNYFEALEGTGYRAALCMVRGVKDSPLNRYFQVQNAEVMFNTMVNCKQSFSINYGSSSDQTMPPITSTIAHNHVYNETSARFLVYVAQDYVADLDVSWKNNLMNQGAFSAFSPEPSEILKGVDPSMVRVGTTTDMFEPAAGSALADYGTEEYPEVGIDIRGRARAGARIPGASLLPGAAITREMPTRDGSGAGFYSPPNMPTNTTPQIKKEMKELDAYALNGAIYTKVQERGTLWVYDFSGKCVHQQRMEEGLNTVSLGSGGMFILRFASASGEVYVKKIACN